MQLSLFENKEIHPVDEFLTQKANVLLEALNEGRKSKEQYQPLYYFQEDDKIVLIAGNKEKKIVCNILDLKGNTPDGFSACWRSVNHIKQELNLYE